MRVRRGVLDTVRAGVGLGVSVKLEDGFGVCREIGFCSVVNIVRVYWTDLLCVYGVCTPMHQGPWGPCSRGIYI